MFFLLILGLSCDPLNGHFLSFFHLAATATRAFSRRCSGDRWAALNLPPALPPIFPPIRPISRKNSAGKLAGFAFPSTILFLVLFFMSINLGSDLQEL